MAGINKFTQKAKRVLSLAQQEAEEENARTIGSEHLLLGLSLESGTAARRVLDDLGVDTEKVRDVLKQLRGQQESDEDLSSDLGDDVKELLEQSLAEALSNNATSIGTEHLILAMSRNAASMAMRVLGALGITPEQVQRQTARIMEEYQQIQDEAKKSEISDEFEKSDVISRRGVSRRKDTIGRSVSHRPDCSGRTKQT
ncbi:MAG: Clp protease N-terminal domain-containing protein [Candidatus Omnitrophota bacterium]